MPKLIGTKEGEAPASRIPESKPKPRATHKVCYLPTGDFRTSMVPCRYTGLPRDIYILTFSSLTHREVKTFRVSRDQFTYDP